MSETVCPQCQGTGYRIVERAGLTGAVRCECANAVRLASVQDNSAIPANYARATLATFQIPQDNPVARSGLGTVLMQVKSYVREFPTDTRPGLLLVGETGTGKTHLAVAVMKALMERGHSALFFDYQNLLDRIRAGYNSTAGTSDKEAYRAALDAEILLLDDLGSHRVTDWVEDTVTSIITYRCNHRKPLIATTNIPDPDITGAVVDYKGPGETPVYKKNLSEVIGTRARSRLFEMCRVIAMPAVEDYRVKKGAR